MPQDGQDIQATPVKGAKRSFTWPFSPVTSILVAVNVLVYIVEMYYGGGWEGTSDSWMLLMLGSKVNILVTDGQWWRLITCMFLHGGIEHLLFNMVALLTWGRVAELLFGKIKFLITYFAAGLVGSIAGYALSMSSSVGASGAIFGLLGAMLYFRRQNKQLFNRVIGVQLFVILGFNIIYGFLHAQVIDNYAHIGGLIGGFMMANIVGLRGDRQVRPIKLVYAAVLTAFVAAGLILGYVRDTGMLF